MAWEAYQAQFQLVAQGQGWSANDLALQLVANLCGSALEVLSHLMLRPWSYCLRVAEALQPRFGSVFQLEVYRAHLKGRARQQSELLPRFAQNLELLNNRTSPYSSDVLVRGCRKAHILNIVILPASD